MVPGRNTLKSINMNGMQTNVTGKEWNGRGSSGRSQVQTELHTTGPRAGVSAENCGPEARCL
jgi:hypothetical protein